MEIEFQRRLKGESQKSYSGLLAVIIPFFSAFVLIDWLMSPRDVFFVQLAIRAVIVLLMIVLYFQVQKRQIDRFPEIFMLLLFTGIVLFALVGNGYESTYFFGLGLICYVVSNLFPWGPKKVAKWVFGMVAVYLLCVSIKAGFHFENTVMWSTCIAVTVSSAIISTWGAYLSDRLRREIYVQSLAVDKRDEFISIASHELKTPLTALRMHLQGTRRGIKPEQNVGPPLEKMANSMDASISQVDRMSRLIDDMLDLSRISLGGMVFRMGTMNLTDLLKETVERFSMQFAQAGITVSLEVDSDVTGVWDRVRIEQVISNLFLNAIKHAKNAPLEISLRRTPEGAVLSIQDHGHGVPADLREKIFNRFERGAAHLSTAGLGLGLYISRQIVQAHHGRIQVEPNSKRGACFTLKLP